jgi:FkbM family methyltransferase
VPSSLKQVARRAVPHSLYRRYRKRKIAAQIATYDAHDVTHLYGGGTLRIRLADPLAEGWYDRDWEEPEVMPFLRDRGVLAPGARIFDLGAHQAVIALMLARDVGDAGHVLAVEAEPHNARIAEVNRELNDARNLTILHAAGGATDGVTSFAEGLNGEVDSRTASGNVMVPMVTVDGLAKEHGVPDLVFIDVEGYEAQVLNGATSTLANGSTSFMVEVHESITAFGGSPRAIADRFRGFERYVAVNDDDPLLALEGSPPAGRFFLVAIPARRA